MALSEKLVRYLSGFGPTYDEMASDPNTFKTLYGMSFYIETRYCGKTFYLGFRADYDIPKAVYLKYIYCRESGQTSIVSSSVDYATECRFPLEWAWV